MFYKPKCIRISCAEYRNMRSLIFLLPLLWSYSLSLNAQGTANPNLERQDSSFWQAKVIVDFGFALGIPTGPFKRNIDQNLAGYQASALLNINKTPGIFGGLTLSNYKFDNANGIYPLNLEGFNANYDVNSWVSLMNLHWTFRVMPPWQRRFTPYLEASVGAKRMGVRSEVFPIGATTDEPIDTYFELQDWAFSYGGALGANYRLTSLGDNDILIQLSVNYYPGIGLDYDVLSDDPFIQNLDPLELYDPKFSTSDLLQVNIGLTFAFGSNYAVE